MPPAKGSESTIEYVIRRPLPESRSSGSEYPLNPAANAKTSSSAPITQLISRGRR